MSGQPNIHPTDAQKFRQQYLANLALQANINERNLQANKIYKKTGMTPTQLTDTRTTSEKLADIERLKIDVRSELSTIADGINANSIVNQLDPVQLQFLAQHINEIIKDIKPKYKYGVEADIFVPYLDAYMNRANQTNEVNFGLQQSSGQNVLLGIQQIQTAMINRNDLEQLKTQIVLGTDSLNRGLSAALTRHITRLIELLPSREFLVNIAQIQDENTKREVQELLNDSLQDIPTRQDVNRVMEQYRQALVRKDAQALNEIASKLDELLALSPAVEEELRQIKQLIEESTKQVEAVAQESMPTLLPPVRASAVRDLTETEIQLLESIYRDADSFGDNPEKTTLTKYLNDLYSATRHRIFTYRGIGSNASRSESVEKLLNGIRNANQIVREAIEEKKRQIGRGLKPRPYRIQGKGIEPTPRMSKYVTFGRYVIDHQRLNDDIVAIKKNDRGESVVGMKVHRVSKGMGNILRDLINGGQPKYKDMSSLNEEERQYLHKLATKSNIIDRIEIPAPDKNDDEKDINQFEIMKGEILNGNDNTDLIKKFKLLITKMINKEILPKNQAKELLIELATLGY